MQRVFLFAIGLVLAGCQSSTTPVSDGVPVVATFYPHAFFAEQIGGEHIQVSQLTPGGVEPHDFEPSARQVADLYESRLFLFNGGIDPWAEKLSETLTQKGVLTMSMAAVVETMESDNEEQSIDPHFWLDPINAVREANAILDALTAADPIHRDAYMRNADVLYAKFFALDAEYRKGLAQCDLRTIVVSHDAFGYLAKRYNIEIIPIAGLSPEDEPSAGHIAALVDLAREKKIGVVFFETLVSPKLAETIAREVGAQALVLNPIEGLTAEQAGRGEDYFTQMRENLRNLRAAMQCL